MNETAFFAHRVLLRAGLSIANVFAWIFLFEYFSLLSGSAVRAFAGSALLYALAQLIALVATPVSAAHLTRGVKHSLIWGSVFAAAAFVFLGGTLVGYFGPREVSPESANGVAWGFIAFAVLLGSYRALYWVPYARVQGEIKSHLHMRAYLEVLVALMPLFAGVTIVFVPFAPPKLLFGSAALIALSILPALFLGDTRERFSWSYAYTLRQLLRRKNHGLVLQSLLDGLQGAALFLVWPLTILLIVERSFFFLGLIFSLTLLFILLLRKSYRYLQEVIGLRDSTIVHVVLVISGWVARLAAGTPVGIIIADVYSHTMQPERRSMIDPFSYEHASDRGAFIDEYTVLKEIALALGKIMLCVVIFLLTFIFSLPLVLTVALLVAGLASAVSVILAQRLAPASY